MDLDLLNQLKDQDQSGRKAYFELLETAERLERGYGQYFKPYSGQEMYFEYGTRPALEFGKHQYHYIATDNPLDHGKVQPTKLVVIKEPKDVQWVRYDILDEDDRVVVRGLDVAKLRTVPTYPKRMMDFIVEYVADFALSRIPALTEAGRGFNVILSEYLDPEFIARMKSMNEGYEIGDPDDFFDEVYCFLDRMLSDVREFMGQNKWMVHIVGCTGLDMVVESYVDYRIYKYTFDLIEQGKPTE